MKSSRNWMTVASMLAASLAGGALSHWALSAGRSAFAQRRPAPRPGPMKVTRANRFEVLDKTGKVLGWFHVLGTGVPSLSLTAPSGRSSITLSLSPDGSVGLGLADKGGKPRAVIGVSADGSTGLSLTDVNGKTRAMLSVLRDGTPSVSLNNKNGKHVIVLGVTPDGAGALRLCDGGGKTVWSAPQRAGR